MKFQEFINLPERLTLKVEAIKKEFDAYAADELVELGEEILAQLAAMAISVYLKQANQKEVYNDFLIGLFTSKSSTYNAGPIYRWAANMLQEVNPSVSEKLYSYFWEKVEAKEILKPAIHDLALLRNAVMHGFFVLPPERNQEEATKMAAILEEMLGAGLFQSWGNFHFLNELGFNGEWGIEDSQWESLQQTFSFGQLVERIRYELSTAFREEEEAFALEKSEVVFDKIQEVQDFIHQREKGALLIALRPNDKRAACFYKNIYQSIDKEKFNVVHYSLHEAGMTFTADFLLRLISKQTGIKELKKENVKNYQKNNPKKLLVLLKDVHIGLFHEKHVLKLVDELYEYGILLLAVGTNYNYLNRYFNKLIEIPSPILMPNEAEWKADLHNFLRFKGPNKDKREEQKAYQQLVEICQQFLTDLQVQKEVVARHFAEKHNYPMEFVHEVFYVFSPYFNSEKRDFKLDEIDELYQFPKEITESSRIFLSLGRRDVKLEYKHKVLTIN